MVKDLTPVEYLQDSLIYQMSLGARELYHSNVWAWLINKDPRFLYVFFDKNFFNSKGIDFNDYAVSAVREYQHRDIIIWLNKKNEKKYYYLVIENKLKSIPTRDQLEGYTVEKLGDNKNKLIGAVVTGIEETMSEEERTINGYTWKFVSYSHIADEIEKHMQKCSLSTTQKQQIEEYGKTILFFNLILTDALNKEQKPTSDGGEQINEAELSTVYKKLHAARFVKKITDKKDALEKELRKGFHFESNNSIQRNEACIDCAYSNWEEKCDEFFRIGIQLQGNQYRRFAQRYKKNGISDGDRAAKELYGRMVDYGWLYKSKIECEIGMCASSQMKGEYCQYKGKEYIFVYQYANLEETIKGTSFDDYIARINEDLDKAKQILCSCDLSELFD